MIFYTIYNITHEIYEKRVEIIITLIITIITLAVGLYVISFTPPITILPAALP